MGIRTAIERLRGSVQPTWLVQADKIIRRFEGCHKVLPSGMVQAYPDPATGSKPWTIGWGSTGEDVHRGTVWTQAQCDARLLSDLTERFGPAVDEMLEEPALPHEKAALASFVYNLGEDQLRRSTLLRVHNAGNKRAAADQFLHWVYANGKVMKGLVRRREAERRLYLGLGQ